MNRILLLCMIFFLGSFTTRVSINGPSKNADSCNDTVKVVTFEEIRLQDNLIDGQLDSIFNEINDNPWRVYKFGAKEWNDTIWWEIRDFAYLEYTVEDFDCKYVLPYKESQIFFFMDDDLVNKFGIPTGNDIEYHITPVSPYWLPTVSILRVLGGFIADDTLEWVYDHYAGKGFNYTQSYSDYDTRRFVCIMNDTLKIPQYINRKSKSVSSY